MISRIVHTSALMLAALLMLGSTIWAQSIEVAAVNPGVFPATDTLTITGTGTLGPILSGSDPLGLNGLSAGVTVMVSESLSPTLPPREIRTRCDIPASRRTWFRPVERARAAASRLAQFSTDQKNGILLAMATAIEANGESILRSNDQDVKASGLFGVILDRLLLTRECISTAAQGVRDIAKLPDPIGELLAEWTQRNGLRIRKARVPLGVIGIIYESRPNVTVDAVALAFKTSNAIVLRGAKEAAHSNQRLVEILADANGVPTGAIRAAGFDYPGFRAGNDQRAGPR